MSSNYRQLKHQSLRVLIVATVLILSTIYGSVILDELTGTTVTPQAYACQPSGGSCG